MNLEEWLASGTNLSSWVEHWTRTGGVNVYVRRCVAHRPVVEVANVHTLAGWGASVHLYRSALRHVPAVAETILNPELDALLHRWGWQEIPCSTASVPSRVSPEFVRLYGRPPPCVTNAHGVKLAVQISRASGA